MKVTIESLTSERRLDRGFDCGEPALNEWLSKLAKQQQTRGIARTYVAFDAADSVRVLGYYALSSAEIETASYPGKHRLPRKVPAVRLGRLAVAHDVQGRRLGESLLMHALGEARRAAAIIGIQCVVVDALNDEAASFYRKYGFAPLTDNPCTLVMAIRTIAATDG